MLEYGTFQRIDYRSIISGLHARAITLITRFQPSVYLAVKNNGNPPPPPKIRGSIFKRFLPVPMKETTTKNGPKKEGGNGGNGNNGGSKPK